jgi:Ni2+-binding GTPase involved in maturation of urease and hydrogenase
MKLHMVNGFLGSGKTTAIIAATRFYLQQGKKVAIVTNDKGHYQVDAAFFKTAQIPTAQVAGGCFRCSFDEFKDQIASLYHTVNPDVLFAESVGSCVDLVNTVFPPLQSIPGIVLEAPTFSVFTDIRLFRRWFTGQPLPFSDSIIYTYGKQIDETQLLVLNKMDLLNPGERSTILQEAQLRFPEKRILLQNSLPDAGDFTWVCSLDKESGAPTMPEFHVDYPVYMDAERKMAWYDRMFMIHPAVTPHSRPGAIAIISNLIQALHEQSIPVAHLKFHISDINEMVKLSFTALDLTSDYLNRDWQIKIPSTLDGSIMIIVNARVEMQSDLFSEMMDIAISSACSSEGIKIETIGGTAYHPQVMPVTH